MNENVTLSLIFLIVAALVGWFVWLISKHALRSRALKSQALLQNKLIDKLMSSKEILEFANSEAAKTLGSMGLEGPRNPFDRILDTAKTGIVSLSLGLACGMLHRLAHSVIPRELFLILAILLVALGIGFLISVVVAYALSRSWGLLDQR